MEERIIIEAKTVPRVEYHKTCHDCGKFLKKAEWVRKDHPRKAHGLCGDCFAKYDGHDY
jgi:hypothetical protein